MIKKITSAIVLLSLAGCFSLGENDELKKDDMVSFEDVNIKYYSDKSLTSLEIPPDLTKPSTQRSFKLSEYVSNVHEDVISFSKKDKKQAKKASKVLVVSSDIEVKRQGSRRWLVVNKPPEKVWNLSKSFLKAQGFKIKKSNKKIGFMETDFLENQADIPDQAVGMIRAMLRKATSAKYALPTIDKYRLRIEPIEKGAKSEVYLTLTSMAEVVKKETDDDDSTIWQSREKDQDLEIKMLYELMLALGGNDADAREKIIRAKQEKKLSVELLKGIGGYAKLKFLLGRRDTWNSIGWALDQLDIDVEDKDVKEGSFYVNVARTEDKGFFSRIFGDDAIKKSFQIMVKEVDSKVTEVYFNDLSEKNEEKTISFSHDLLSDIAKQFQ